MDFLRRWPPFQYFDDSAGTDVILYILPAEIFWETVKRLPRAYPSPAVESVLGRTHGVPIFQEQVIQVAVAAAGFDAGEADLVRRSMAA